MDREENSHPRPLKIQHRVHRGGGAIIYFSEDKDLPYPEQPKADKRLTDREVVGELEKVICAIWDIKAHISGNVYGLRPHLEGTEKPQEILRSLISRIKMNPDNDF